MFPAQRVNEEFLLNPPMPEYVQFETEANHCNASCLMCPRTQMTRKGHASWTLLSKIMRETLPTAKHVAPFFMQEPFLEPRLISILANVKQHLQKVGASCKTIVFTNMSTLTDTQIHMIVEYDLIDELRVSFYGPTKQLYSKWQPPLDRKTTVDNLHRLRQARDKAGKTLPHTVLQLLAVPELADALSSYGDVKDCVDVVGWVAFDTMRGRIPLLVSDAEQEKIMHITMGGPAPCSRLWTSMTILANGDVVPCCCDYDGEHVLGNILERSAREIWMGTEAQKLRAQHLALKWGEVPLCRDCVTYKWYYPQGWREAVARTS
jgi:radical SAM protein with 4Fe4S-binding SPASM domain